MELAQLAVDEESVKSRWLWALGASRAPAQTSAGLRVRFSGPSSVEFLGERPKGLGAIELISSAFDAPVRVAADIRALSGDHADLGDSPTLASVASRSCTRLPVPPG